MVEADKPVGPVIGLDEESDAVTFDESFDSYIFCYLDHMDEDGTKWLTLRHEKSTRANRTIGVRYILNDF